MIIFTKVNKEHEKQVSDYKNEMFNNNEFKLNGCGNLENYDDYQSWLNHLDSYSDKTASNFNHDFVEGTQCILLDTNSNMIIGMVNIRHYLNAYLSEYGGHIGYSIRSSYRMQGYGILQLKYAIAFLQTKDIKEIVVTCNDENVASYKTIEACGGALVAKNTKDNHLVRKYVITP